MNEENIEKAPRAGREGQKRFRVALAGNPNCGKTTIFNALTGAHQHVGNYSGVTVERKTGICRAEGLEIEIVDLPGIYSLSSASPEEKVAFNELTTERIDLILNVVDASNPQRNLYLTTQLAELEIPMLLVFNMSDDAHRRGLKFRLPVLEHYFGARIVRTVGSKGLGLEHMKSVMARLLTIESPRLPVQLRFGKAVDQAVDEISDRLAKITSERFRHVPRRCFAIKLLECDSYVCKLKEFAELVPEASKLRERLAIRLGVDAESLLPDSRYGMISGACREAVQITNERRQQVSDEIDKYLTNRYLGAPIFLLIMFVLFAMTFYCATPFSDLLGFFFGRVAAGICYVWPETTLPFLRSLLTDGIIGGVGGVLEYLPNIMFLFLGIAFLEGTGYMARAAYVMDGFMHIFGLHGKSFIPMLLGFGCTAPAVMATRSIESEKDRLTTIMILPLMSCSARLPIYMLFIPAFFNERLRAPVMWIIYVTGILIALGLSILLKHTAFMGGDEVYVMELPPYRMPTFKSLMIQMWERASMYLRKAGTLILAASIVLFVLNSLPRPEKYTKDYDGMIASLEKKAAPSPETEKAIEKLRAEKRAENLRCSIAGRIGVALEPALKPIGFDWRISTALIGAFAAKELFVAQLGIIYSVADGSGDSLRAELRSDYTPLQAFCIMLFCLISMPCIGTFAVVRRETNSLFFALAQLAGLTLTAWCVSFAVYHIGLFLRLGIVPPV